MLGTSACHRGSKLFAKTQASLTPCPSHLSPEPLSTAAPTAAPEGAVAASAINREPLQGSQLCLSQMPFASLAQAALQLLCRHSGVRLNRGFGSALVILPLSAQELPMAINVKPTSKGPGDTAQTASLPRSLLWPPEGPCFPPAFPAGNAAAAGGLCAGLGGHSLPGGWRLPYRSCSASEGEAALERPLRSSLPPSVGGQLPPASRWPAAGPICSRGRLPLPCTEAADGSGAEASEAALCQGAPDWLTGLCNGYLLQNSREITGSSQVAI
ncbi:uncharacterized protein LOC111929894 isoform X2 [Cyanistes caeruleus]|uniref:uncharacterized protein LOC111929894 isoform X2 n=1 Tax=Cyanistes caeruleus TaxID=156563 RepID=UPI000CDA2B4A|nr:uncharacterized protein LOC111929894 isoform X2 [Cyanistes caeruleus]